MLVRVDIVRIEIALLRQVAYFAFGLMFLSIAVTAGLLAAHVIIWVTGRRIDHFLLGDLLGLESRFLSIPLCSVSAVTALVSLYLFCGAWGLAVKKDIQRSPRES